ncbi:MAG: hypothetical protein BJ554DRAFT_3869 [Olpidium bornovanus]|uniref:Uncharacterized protein n=1 Tax=Olpidium bornovanus TaxID=278681 RepID=A0A8H7ZN08_9FUNG|nr:MAG: hypothetical protein BJ554DRAFT_3869 [Olpidium bornovanus]
MSASDLVAPPPSRPYVIEAGSCLCRAHQREVCLDCGTDYAALNAAADSMRQSGGWLPPPNPQMALRAAKLREQGNGCFKKGEAEAAVKFYTAAVELARSRPIWEPSKAAREDLTVNLCNRAAAYLELKRFHEARADAYVVTRLRADWPKAHYRHGRALEALGLLPEAEEAYERGLAFDPKNSQMVESLEALKKRMNG